MPNSHHGAPAPICATRAYDFCSYNPERDCLFSVRAGIPAGDALEMASCFLDVARSAMRQLGEDGGGASAYAADHLITQAKALGRCAVAGAAGKDDHAATRLSGCSRGASGACSMRAPVSTILTLTPWRPKTPPSSWPGSPRSGKVVQHERAQDQRRRPAGNARRRLRRASRGRGR